MAELKVGNGWRYQCWNCNRQVKIDEPWPANCPGCGAGGWWGHLVTTGGNGKPGQKIEDGTGIKTTKETTSVGIITPKIFLSQEKNANNQPQRQNKGVYEPSSGQVRGRPSLTVPESLILELASQGLSSRAMAARLNEQGIALSYKTIQRRLQGSLL